MSAPSEVAGMLGSGATVGQVAREMLERAAEGKQTG